MTIERNSDLARAFRCARHYSGESGGVTAARRPAHLAITEARRRLERLDELAAEYRDAQGAGADDNATPIPADTPAAMAARSKLTSARLCFGLYTSADSWGRFYPDTDSAFRETVAAHDVDGGPDHKGYYDNPYSEAFKDGTGLCYGVVCRLPGRDGKARFVAGYQFGGCDGGPTLDLTRVFESETDSPWESPDAMRDAARAADGLAETAAEKEREYKAAWQAGTEWAGELETVQEARKEALAILQERRAARGAGNFPALCAAIRGQVEALRDTIRESRGKMAALAGGDSESLYFWTGDSELRGAFCEGAGLDKFPA